MASPIVREYDKLLYKKCIKCRAWKPRVPLEHPESGETIKPGFGKHKDSSDGLQSICFTCKNAMNIKGRQRNVFQRIRHHTATRCLTQLGDLAPEEFVANLEDYLGYKIKALVRHLSKDLKEREGPQRSLKKALAEGYHVDHIRPLSLYKVVVTDVDGQHVDWDEFRKCWDIQNLKAIPATENLAKGAKYEPA